MCAYIERQGFSIAFTALSKRDGVSERTKGIVMGSFFVGYAISQVPGGMLAQRIGGRPTLIISFIGWSLFCLLTPPSANSAILMSLVRVMVGLFQGFLIPSVHTVLSEWLLPHERATFVSLCTSGMYLGSAMAIQFLPSLIRAFNDPTIVFRAVGGLGFAWLVLWMAFGEEVKHRAALIPLTITQAEPSSKQNKGDSKSVAPTPWSRILRHPAVWAIVINNFTFHYSFYVIMQWMPTYFESLLGRDLQHVGFGKPLPYLLMFAMSNVGGWLGDWFIARGYSVATGRKFVNTLGFCLAVSLMLLMPGATDVAQGLVVLTLCLGACGMSRGGFSVNHMDIAPRYAGVVMGLSNTAGTISGVIGVSATGWILEAAGGSEKRLGWYQAHSLAGLMSLAGVAVFIVWGRGERLFT
jgi:MFS transporter, ACS family, solute carrier family 17 (sodium-dependent inorganic phosphate cotransporter), other